MCFHLFISLLTFTLVSSLRLLICLCDKETGEILILKNANAPFQYSMPELRSDGKFGQLDHSKVVSKLPSFGIDGYVSKKTLFYTSPEDRKKNPDRSKFMRIRVNASWDIPGVHGVEKMWVKFYEAANYLRDHPNGDYKLFYEYISDYPQWGLSKEKGDLGAVSSIRVICFCMNAEGKVLVLKNPPLPPSRVPAKLSETHFRFGFPEFQLFPGETGSISNTVRKRLFILGIKMNGKAGKSIPYFVPEENHGAISEAYYRRGKFDVRDNGRALFYRLYAKEFTVFRKNCHNIELMFVSFEESAQILRNHPTEDYKMFLDFVMEEPEKVQLVKRNGILVPYFSRAKKIALFCTSYHGGILLVNKQTAPYYGLPEISWNDVQNREQRCDVLLTRLMNQYGIVGSVKVMLGEIELNPDQYENSVIIMGYHVEVTKQNEYGVISGKINGRGPAIQYRHMARIWKSLTEVDKFFRGTPYEGMYDLLLRRKYQEWNAARTEFVRTNHNIFHQGYFQTSQMQTRNFTGYPEMEGMHGGVQNTGGQLEADPQTQQKYFQPTAEEGNYIQYAGMEENGYCHSVHSGEGSKNDGDDSGSEDFDNQDLYQTLKMLNLDD